ncbi:response regulator, partial [candidate division KSB1 bacterium]|nr:response regulator [candidate division KSB1 bacterium]
SLLHKNIFDLMLLDIRLPNKDGMQVLKEAHEIDPDLLVVMITAHGTIQSAVEAMKAGAYDFLMKPFELDELRLVVAKALETQKLKREVNQLRRKQQNSKYPDDAIFSNHPKMQEVKGMIKIVAETPRTSVLIQGESGTGKELVANAVHNWSARRDKQLVKINCSAIPEHLLESELFGHEKGAFTDAKTLKKGMFELANGGTLFLDEISSMKLSLQPKLLRVLETQRLRRIGGTIDLGIDVRIIAATNQDLQECVQEGLFRADLYYRLKVMVINLPPLRDRASDILLLTKLFIERNNKEFNKNITGMSAEAEQLLQTYPWPGNVRELKNVIERAVILCRNSKIQAEHLPMELRSTNSTQIPVSPVSKQPTAPEPTQPSQPQPETTSEPLSLQDIERKHILATLKRFGGNKSKAARVLNISRSTLREKLKLYGIN